MMDGMETMGEKLKPENLNAGEEDEEIGTEPFAPTKQAIPSPLSGEQQIDAPVSEVSHMHSLSIPPFVQHQNRSSNLTVRQPH